jgi:hypothetical protein
MPFYATKLFARKAQTNAKGVQNTLFSLVEADLGSPVLDDVDRIVTTVSMKNGSYTIAAQPDVPRNITITHTAVSTVDTLGVITITGTDRNDDVLTEVITPLNGTIASGTKAFKSIVSVVGSAWSSVAGDDSIVVGVGGLIGLPDKLSLNRVLYGYLNASKEGTIPTLTISATVLSLNTVDFNTAWGGTAASVGYFK